MLRGVSVQRVGLACLPVVAEAAVHRVVHLVARVLVDDQTMGARPRPLQTPSQEVAVRWADWLRRVTVQAPLPSGLAGKGAGTNRRSGARKPLPKDQMSAEMREAHKFARKLRGIVQVRTRSGRLIPSSP